MKSRISSAAMKTALALSVAALPFVACKGAFKNCQDLRTCADDGGQGGEGGAPEELEDEAQEELDGEIHGNGGEGGAAFGDDRQDPKKDEEEGEEQVEPPECEDASDCAPADGCDLAEECVGGECADSVSACGDFDSDNCECEADDSDECVLQGVDEDGDGHFSAACEAAPGGDCEDDNKEIHPEAEELCDGIDNNCNGDIDLGDGLELGGETQSAPGGGRLDVAWSTKEKEYGLASPLIGVDLVSLSEEGVLGDSQLVMGGLAESYVYTPRIVFGDSAFGVFLATQICQTDDCFTLNNFKNMDGKPESEQVQLPRGLEFTVVDIAFHNDQWLFAHNDEGTLQLGHMVGLQGVVVESLSSSGASVSGRPRLAVHEDELAVVWPGDGFYWGRFAKDLSLNGFERLTDEEAQGGISSVPLGYALAWVSVDGLSFQLREANGSLLCETESIEFGEAAGTLGSAAVVLAPTEGGTLALAADPSGSEVRLFYFNDECELLGSAAASADADGASLPGLAVGDESVAITWSEKVEGEEVGHYRVMKTALCE